MDIDLSVLRLLEREREIPFDELVEIIEQAILTAYIKHTTPVLPVDAPKDTPATVYRLGTKVRKSATNKKLFPTFTLPQGVDLTV